MRFLFVLLAIAAVLPFCTKKKTSESVYIGTWELKTSDGMSGHVEYEPGNGFKMTITEDSLYEYGNGSLQYTRAFGLVKDTLRGYGTDRLADKLSPDIVSGFATFFELKGNTLIRYAGIPALDGGSSTYVRIK
ncbi:hypothetical protein LZZ85_17075 [Terrimonas sp. NA20]|uniref:Lipocalin-like domain-containing protein n=1 Tax=Terrimonas ginsenosidimutans TaxID=2908004 RepID=A0ABS9KUM3_9BACT|nr:hypothetical protein [Terrimonas ginsenosidimutans]MCG2616013.1 hypothetical protein [Terrimonas ginsenosidimutans]